MNKLKGKHGEILAVNYLKNNDHTIIETNFSCKVGEIDIISLKDDFIVFSEVKYRTTKNVSALYAINKRKQQHIIKTALLYLKLNQKYFNYQIRFDVISIIKNKFDKYEFEYIENAFRP